MDRFNYQINDSDIERVLLESQNNLLHTIEPINVCEDTSSFLSPINDILSEVTEYGRGICSEQPSVLATTNDGFISDHSWRIPDPVYDFARDSNENSSFIGINYFETKMLQQPQGRREENDFRNSNGRVIDLSYVEAEYTSSINHCFQDLEHQQQHMGYLNDPPLPLNFSQLKTNTTKDQNNAEGGIFNSKYSANFLFNNVGLDSNHPINLVNTPITLDTATNNSELVENKSNIATCLVPIPIKKTLQQQEAGYFSNAISSEPVSHALLREADIQLTSSKLINKNQNILAVDINYSKMSNSSSVANPAYQHKKLINQQYPAERIRHMSSVGLGYANKRSWASVFPRKTFPQPSEMIILHPLRTRQIISTRRITTANIEVVAPIEDICSSKNIATPFFPPSEAIQPLSLPRSNSNNPLKSEIEHKNFQMPKSLDNENVQHESGYLSEYFDTTSINIPMIKDRSRSEVKNENRRKQKLRIIPGAENLIFELHGSDSLETDDIKIKTTIGSSNSNYTEDPYPETELPQLNDIFRRKKKTTTVTSIRKRSYISVGNKCGYTDKKPCSSRILTSAVEKSPEKITDPIHKGKSNLSVKKSNLILSSESDSADDGQLQTWRSLKCNKCTKIFKTNRSLAKHLKNCVNLDKINSVADKDVDNNFGVNNNDIRGDVDIIAAKSGAKLTPQYSKKIIQSPKSFLKSSDIKRTVDADFKHTGDTNKLCARISETSDLCVLPNEKKNPRPITRSQTRRSTGRSIPYSAFAKHSK